jgi:hypothetical protein
VLPLSTTESISYLFWRNKTQLLFFFLIWSIRVATYWLQPSLMSVAHFSKPNLLTLGLHCTRHFSKHAFALFLSSPRIVNFTNFICLHALETLDTETPLKSDTSSALPFTHDLRMPFQARQKTFTMIRLSPLFMSGYVLLPETALCSRLHEWYCRCSVGLIRSWVRYWHRSLFVTYFEAV